MNANLGPLLTIYRTNIDLCQEMAEIILSGTERIEQAGLNVLRSGVRKSLGAARQLSDGGDAASSFKPAELEDLFSSYRDVMEVVSKTNADLTRTVTEYCTNYSKGVAGSIGETMPPVGGNPMQQFESLMKMWGGAYQQFSEFAKQASQLSGGEGPAEAAKRPGHKQ